MPDMRVCIDVPDMDRAIDFYRSVFGLRLGRRLGLHWVEMLGSQAPIDLLGTAEGTPPASALPAMKRQFGRHWTPVHLDFVVDDLDEVLRRALAEGATLDRPVQERPFGRMANIADPFGNGLCLLQMNARGYDALLDEPEKL